MKSSVSLSENLPKRCHGNDHTLLGTFQALRVLEVSQDLVLNLLFFYNLVEDMQFFAMNFYKSKGNCMGIARISSQEGRSLLARIKQKFYKSEFVRVG